MDLNSSNIYSCQDTPSASSVKLRIRSNPSPERPRSSSPNQLRGLIDCTSPPRAAPVVTESLPSNFCAAQPEPNSEKLLTSWFQPSSYNSARTINRRSRAPPSKGENVHLQQGRRGKRPWADLLADHHMPRETNKAQSERDQGSLSAWLEPQRPCGGKRRAIVGRARDGRAADESPSKEPPREEEDGDEDWMSTRLEGLDPNGAAKAKDGWTIRTKRNLTITDIALGAKRKTQGGRGWKTTLGGGKVFVAPSQGRPALVATGQKAFKMSMSRRKKGAL